MSHDVYAKRSIIGVLEVQGSSTLCSRKGCSYVVCSQLATKYNGPTQARCSSGQVTPATWLPTSNPRLGSSMSKTYALRKSSVLCTKYQAPSTKYRVWSTYR